MNGPARMAGLAALVLALPAAVMAAPNLTDLLKEETAALAPLEQLTERILLSEQEQDDAAREVTQLVHQIAEADRRLEALDGKEKERSTLLRGRLRQMYKASRGGFFRLAFNAQEGEDLFSLLSSASLVLRRDVRELKLYQREQALHLDQRRKLRVKRLLKEKLTKTLSRTRQELKEQRAQLKGRLRTIHGDRRKAQQLQQSLTGQQRELLRHVLELRRTQEEAGGFMTRKGSLPRPVSGRIAKRFGQQKVGDSRMELRHQGLTFNPGRRASVRAVAGGKVRHAGTFSGYGQLVIVEHPGGFFSIYGFLSQIAVTEGDGVKEGQNLGVAGIDPMSGSRAAYFELRHGRHALDPAEWLRL